jgi:uncharacterized protein
MKLDPPLTRDLVVERGLRVPMPDGVELLADRWAPRTGGDGLPTALIRRTRRALRTLPLSGSDVAAVGKRVDYVQGILAHDASAPRWEGVDHRHRVAATSVPVSSIGGWFDIFLPGQLRDFQILRSSGRTARLTVGPWTHAEFTNVGVQEAVEFGFHLQPDGGLSTSAPADSLPDTYRYDPVDPTPAVGGVRMSDGGRVDNIALEARPDVLTYTTPALDADVEVIGEVSAEIWFRSSLPHADVFVRLCDVDERGRSTNVCDGLVSLTGADETRCATVRLWPTAYRFARGHRIRVQVSSGAFPRYARNPGTGEPHATATRLLAADQQVHHDPEHPSAILLPTLA